MLNRRCFVAFTASLIFDTSASAQTKFIVVAATTSMQDSGLFDHILPLFTAKSGIDFVKVVAQDTGRAFDTGRRGGADVLFVHTKSAEEKFIAEGFGVKRYPVMYNDFVLIGPKSDPAGLRGSNDIIAALSETPDHARPFHFAGRSVRHECDRARSLEILAGIDISAEKGSRCSGKSGEHGSRA